MNERLAKTMLKTVPTPCASILVGFYLPSKPSPHWLELDADSELGAPFRRQWRRRWEVSTGRERA